MREIDDRWCLAQALNHLGQTSQAVGRAAEARRCFQEALELSLASQTLPVALEALVGLARDAAPEAALPALAYVASEPASGIEARERALGLVEELSAGLPPDPAARQRGRAMTLAAAVGLVRAPGWLDLNRAVQFSVQPSPPRVAV